VKFVGIEEPLVVAEVTWALEEWGQGEDGTRELVTMASRSQVQPLASFFCFLSLLSAFDVFQTFCKFLKSLHNYEKIR
jgi:hypothetical protein